ncbi:DUF4349 domain-containing protein [Pontixanthobacter sp.]|uniref:DUF4349 domain-containing protein n=1 Tax=Pontixanthobacter sp. TaxID=2792078 RepID=UPI003C7B4CFA
MMGHWKYGAALALLGLSLAGCSENAETSPEASSDISATTSTPGAAAPQSAPADAEMAAPSEAFDPAIATSMPKLAYRYGYSYEIPGADMPGLMRKHANVCEQQGPSSCRIIGMEVDGRAEDNSIRGTLQLAVAAPHARAVGALLEDEAETSGAEQLSANIAADDVAKNLVDTQARIRSQTQLRDRLLEVLKTRRGSVEDLIAAERQVAQVNEEIDQAKSWLAETKGRVSFSTLDIQYSAANAPASSFTDPIEGALGSMGAIFGWVIAMLLMVGAAVLPIGAAVWLGRTINRRLTAAEAAVAEG